jgi:methionyl-tRNA formyltransferase
MNKLKVIFMGTPDFSVPALDAIFNHSMVELLGVVSMPDRPSGRGQELKSPEVIEFCKSNQINFFQTENINKDLNWIEERPCDLIVVLAFAQFLGEKILKHPRLGCFNIHTSLLPKYRGAAPIQYALLNGDDMTGVSIQRMVKKMDAGNIVYDRKCEIPSFMNGGQLYTRLKYLAAVSVGEFIDQLILNKLTNVIQNEDLVTFAPTLKKEDGFIDFSQTETLSILRKIRALDPWPGTYCFINNKRLKIFWAETFNSKLKPGAVDTSRGMLLIGTLNGTLRLTDVQWEGKKRSTDQIFLNGIKDELNLTEKR